MAVRRGPAAGEVVLGEPLAQGVAEGPDEVLARHGVAAVLCERAALPGVAQEHARLPAF